MSATSGTTADELLTRDDVAALFRVSLRTVSRWVSDGELAAFRLDGVLRFRRSEIDRFIEARSQ